MNTTAVRTVRRNPARHEAVLDVGLAGAESSKPRAARRAGRRPPTPASDGDVQLTLEHPDAVRAAVGVGVDGGERARADGQRRPA